VRAGGKVFHGGGADTDILVASATAYLRALNRVFASAGGGAAWQPPEARSETHHQASA
jgi:hypothetical protein